MKSSFGPKSLPSTFITGASTGSMLDAGSAVLHVARRSVKSRVRSMALGKFMECIAVETRSVGLRIAEGYFVRFEELELSWR